MKTVPLVETYTVTFDGNGNGTVIMAPKVYGHSWHVTRIATTCTTPNTQQVTFNVYRNTQSNSVGGTYLAQNDSDDTDLTLKYGERLIGVYTGGRSGDTGSVTIIGEVTNER